MPKEKKEKKAKTLETGLEDVDMADAAGGAKKKVKKEEIEISLEELSPIAHPLAQKKLAKKLHKTIRRASRCRQVKRGVKEVVKGIRKGEKGYDCAALYARLFIDDTIMTAQNPRSCCGYQPHGHHLTFTWPQRGAQGALCVCVIKGGAGTCKFDKTTDELCDDLPEHEKTETKGKNG
ncbi:hypothetical protein FRC20_008780 [Serendipita sp. 405]|nr:hypothetical protein FRC20_008780 [Serendipita sp. 405]